MADLTADDRRILALYEELAHDPLGLDASEPDPRTVDILREMRAVVDAESDVAAAKLIAWWGAAFADETERVEWVRTFRARAGVRRSTMTERAVWTAERAYKDGYYWWHDDEETEPVIVELYGDPDAPWGDDERRSVQPIPSPARLAALEELERAARDCVRGWKIENEASRDALMAALRALDTSGAVGDSPSRAAEER